ncbi:MAG: hypothetical protein IJ240_04195, partial [Clostridia bacterium]|nr:hypothetical protein [Clostridia bacterium]
NRALFGLSVEDGKAFVRVMNFGPAADVSIAVYAYTEDGEELADVKRLSLNANEGGSLSFDVPQAAYYNAELREKDALSLDDARWFVPASATSYTVALAGSDSVFLDAALALRKDIRVLRASEEELSRLTADLYIRSGETLSFSRLAEGDQAISALPAVEGPCSVTNEGYELTEGLSFQNTSIKSVTPLMGGRALLYAGGYSVLSQTTDSVALGFDIHDSNLPLQYEFPLLIGRILGAMLPENGRGVPDGYCGQALNIVLPRDASAALLTLPDGEVVTVPDAALQNGEFPFAGTDRPGLYTLRVSEEKGETVTRFCMSVPEEESDVRHAAQARQAAGSGSRGSGSRELSQILLWCFLALLLIEWGLSRFVV